MKSYLRKSVLQITDALGLCDARVRVPWGASLWHDLKRARLLPDRPVLFDIGANVGQTSREMKRHFPNARIECFEPCLETFRILELNTNQLNDVRCHRLALSDRCGEARLKLFGQSVLNQLEEADPDDHLQPRVGVESVPVTTLDEYLAIDSLDRIDLLKIDAEGSDLAVIRGARETIGSGSVRLVYCEVGFGASRYALLDEVLAETRALGLTLLGVYSQVPDVWVRSGASGLDHANALFIREGTPSD